MIEIRNISWLAVTAFTLLLTAFKSETVESANPSQSNGEGIHAFFTSPVEIPIDREVHHKLLPQDDRHRTRSESENLVVAQEQKPGKAQMAPVNIQFHTQNPDGSYHFGYDIGTAHGRSYREERREASGRVVGQYGYMDPAGNMYHFEYEADSNGYRLKPKQTMTTTTETVKVEISTPAPTTKEPFRLKMKPVPIIGPIPKTWTQLFGPEPESSEDPIGAIDLPNPNQVPVPMPYA